MTFSHVPVLKEETISALALKDNGVYFDGTLGGGNHSKEILSRTKNSRLFATDLDAFAIESAKENLKEFGDRLTVYHDNFKNFKTLFEDGQTFDGILLDLGVSSAQLDMRERGFSYLGENERLDMRMNGEQPFSAYELVNGYPQKEIERVLRDYGEEKFFKRIAENIVAARDKKNIETCGELVEIIERSIPFRFKKDGHPAKRTFQAIRIEVNGELDGLDTAIYDMADKLKRGGRLAIITFHSLEDRIVKTVFKDLCTGCVCDKRLPVCVCNRVQKCTEVTKKPIVATEKELKDNPRAKSAKLRVIEKL